MRPQGRTGRAKPPWRLSARTLITCSISTIIGFSAICASVMIDLRRGEEVRARQSLENLAAGIGADIRNIELYDLSLRAVAGNMLLPEIKEVSKPVRHLILFVCISDSVRRAGDCAARYGGEEFAVLLPGTSDAAALHVAETIRCKVAIWAGEASNTSISIGVASIAPPRDTDWSSLLNAADKALYAAKAAGRNRCVTIGVPKPSAAASLAA